MSNFAVEFVVVIVVFPYLLLHPSCGVRPSMLEPGRGVMHGIAADCRLITPCCSQDRSGKGPQQVSATTIQREALSLYVPLHNMHRAPCSPSPQPVETAN